jgi:hypothetical protein
MRGRAWMRVRWFGHPLLDYSCLGWDRKYCSIGWSAGLQYTGKTALLWKVWWKELMSCRLVNRRSQVPRAY